MSGFQKPESVHFRIIRTFVYSFAAVLIALWISIFYIECNRDVATAQEHLADYVILARAGAKEESLFPGAGQSEMAHALSALDGMSLIDSVYSRGATRTRSNYEHFARQYSPHLFAPEPGRPWVADLRVGSHIPNGWPPGLFWNPDPSHRRPDGFTLWMHMIHGAQEIIAGHVPLSCPVHPDHWGGPMDHLRGLANGWIYMRCGTSRNEGWIVPAWHTLAERDLARSSTLR